MDKKKVAAILDEMGTLLELQGANPFKSRAFHTASRALEGVTQDLRSLAESGGLLEVQGIGKSIAQIISDLVTTGRSGDYDPRLPEAARGAGYTAVATAKYGWNDGGTSRWELRRIGVESSDTVFTLRAKLNGALDLLALAERPFWRRVVRRVNRMLEGREKGE